MRCAKARNQRVLLLAKHVLEYGHAGMKYAISAANWYRGVSPIDILDLIKQDSAQ